MTDIYQPWDTPFIRADELNRTAGTPNAAKRVLQARNYTNQFSALDLNVSALVDFGTAATNEPAFVNYTGTTFQLLQAGVYFAQAKFQLARTASPQTCIVAFRTQYTPAGGPTSNGDPIAFELDDQDTSIPYTFYSVLPANAGDTYSVEFVKVSGPTTIQLQADTISTPGWSDSASAALTLYKLNENGSIGGHIV